MHELSIALSILEVAQEESDRRGGIAVEAIYVRIGVLSGVVPAALVFSYELARENTAFENCRLIIEDVAVVVYCPKCRAERASKSPELYCCAECGTPASEIVRGRELQIRALELAA